ncbi:uncharacterized protein C16orf52 homolog B [Tachysurus ichikawai]
MTHNGMTELLPLSGPLKDAIILLMAVDIILDVLSSAAEPQSSLKAFTPAQNEASRLLFWTEEEQNEKKVETFQWSSKSCSQSLLTLYSSECSRCSVLRFLPIFSLLFSTVILFCMAALIFPIGFYINEVGGQPYKLPNNTVVGSSYVLFVLSIFFTIVGLLFAGKVCLPG